QSLDRKMIFVQSDHWAAQLNQIIRELGLTAAQTRPFSRCLHCNVPIVAAEKSSLRGRVPDYIFESHEHFQKCPNCNSIYWPGTHTQRSLEKIRQFFK
ncbi:MAG: Mut7-C RNAse domain-containing protein, partial [Desulfobacterales bacterium]